MLYIYIYIYTYYMRTDRASDKPATYTLCFVITVREKP